MGALVGDLVGLEFCLGWITILLGFGFGWDFGGLDFGVV